MREAFVGVSNEQTACVGLATMLAQAGVTHHGIYVIGSEKTTLMAQNKKMLIFA